VLVKLARARPRDLATRNRPARARIIPGSAPCAPAPALATGALALGTPPVLWAALLFRARVAQPCPPLSAAAFFRGAVRLDFSKISKKTRPAQLFFEKRTKQGQGCVFKGVGHGSMA